MAEVNSTRQLNTAQEKIVQAKAAQDENVIKPEQEKKARKQAREQVAQTQNQVSPAAVETQKGRNINKNI